MQTVQLKNPKREARHPHGRLFAYTIVDPRLPGEEEKPRTHLRGDGTGHQKGRNGIIKFRRLVQGQEEQIEMLEPKYSKDSKRLQGGKRVRLQKDG